MNILIRKLYHSVTRIPVIKYLNEKYFLILVFLLKKKKNHKISLLIIGSQKGGTTFLHDFLVKNFGFKESFFRKEVHFFDKYFELGSGWYEKQFPFNKKLLDSSPSYSIVPGVAKLIFKYNNNMKLIFIKRDPVERAISHYRHNIKRGFISRNVTFEAALKIEENVWGDYYFNQNIKFDEINISEKHLIHSYYMRGLYTWQLKPWGELFKDNLLIIDFELLKYHDDLYRSLADFLSENKRFPSLNIKSTSKRNSYVWSGGISEETVLKLASMYKNDSRF